GFGFVDSNQRREARQQQIVEDGEYQKLELMYIHSHVAYVLRKNNTTRKREGTDFFHRIVPPRVLSHARRNIFCGRNMLLLPEPKQQSAWCG
ncbi:MAG: hypothetical protein ABJO88_17540, partial [Parasphingorhabdus sp.]